MKHVISGNKTIYLLLCLIFISLTINIFKSYTIYKLEKSIKIIDNNEIALTLDEEESNDFPKKDENYDIRSIECTNGVIGSWDLVNWKFIVNTNDSPSTRCVLKFSTSDNEYDGTLVTKKEIITQNNEYDNIVYSDLKNVLLDKTYPIGSIYMTTEDDTVDKVQTKFGGTWVKYSEGTALIGANTEYKVNSNGGLSSVTLNESNLPGHTHSFTATGSVSSTFTGVNANTTTVGEHSHPQYGAQAQAVNSNVRIVLQGDGNFVAYHTTAGAQWSTGTNGNGNGPYRVTTIGLDGTTSTNGNHRHSVTPTGSVSSSFKGTSSNTISCTNCTGNSFSVLNPYKAVYMYKRTA